MADFIFHCNETGSNWRFVSKKSVDKIDLSFLSNIIKSLYGEWPEEGSIGFKYTSQEAVAISIYNWSSSAPSGTLTDEDQFLLLITSVPLWSAFHFFFFFQKFHIIEVSRTGIIALFSKFGD